MYRFVAFIIQTLITFPTMITVWLLSFFAFDQSFLSSSGISLGLGAAVFFGISFVLKSRYLNKHGLTKKEYSYIRKNLKQGKQKIFRANKALFSIRHQASLKQRMELIKLTRKIYALTNKEPKRFFQAEQFYFTHLDSIVELSEKYVFISRQKMNNSEIDLSLHEARRTLEELTVNVEKDLHQILNEDIEQLRFEIDVAKHSIKNQNDNTQLIDESRKLK